MGSIMDLIPGALRRAPEAEEKAEQGNEPDESTEVDQVDDNFDAEDDDDVAEPSEDVAEVEPTDEEDKVSQLERQLRQLQAQVSAEKQTAQTQGKQQQIEAILAEVEGKDFMEGADVAKMMRKLLETTTGNQSNQPPLENDTVNQYVLSHPFYKTAKEIVETDKALWDKVSAIPTNSAGRLYALQVEKLKEQMKKKEELLRKAQAKLKKADRGPVPTTGPSGNGVRGGGNSRVSTKGMSHSAARTVNFLNKLGGS